MQILNRDRPMRAIHRKTGAVTEVHSVNQSKALAIGTGLNITAAYFDRHGNPKDDFCPWRVENVGVDWSKPIEAVHDDGRIVSVCLSQHQPHAKMKNVEPSLDEGSTFTFMADGSHYAPHVRWRIRNTQNYTEQVMELADAATLFEKQVREPSTIPVDKALWERVVGLIRDMAGWPTASTPPIRFELEARAIAELLRPVVDEDLIEAREVAASMYDNGRNELLASNVRKGLRDDGMDVSIALAAIARGRALERGE